MQMYLRFVRELAPIAPRQDHEENAELHQRGEELDPIDVVDGALNEFKMPMNELRKAHEDHETDDAYGHRQFDAEGEKRRQKRPALRCDHAGSDLS